MSEDVTGMPIRAVTETERATALQMAAEAEDAIRGGWVPKTICSSSVERHNRANAERFFAEASSRSKRPGSTARSPAAVGGRPSRRDRPNDRRQPHPGRRLGRQH